MSLSPEARSSDLSTHYVYNPASAACTRKIINEAPSSFSFTSARASPAPSAGNLNRNLECGPKTSGTLSSYTSYKQALADANAEGGEGRRLPVRQQSWNEQDLKREMQLAFFGEGGKEEMQGFSEKECGEYIKGEGE
jgi:hypothetical protein